jgi:hypothetical protein
MESPAMDHLVPDEAQKWQNVCVTMKVYLPHENRKERPI